MAQCVDRFKLEDFTENLLFYTRYRLLRVGLSLLNMAGDSPGLALIASYGKPSALIVAPRLGQTFAYVSEGFQKSDAQGQFSSFFWKSEKV